MSLGERLTMLKRVRCPLALIQIISEQTRQVNVSARLLRLQFRES